MKSVLTQLHDNESTKHKIISNEEQNAIIDLTNFAQKLQEYIDDIDSENTDYNVAIKCFDKKLDDEFDLMFEQLTKRKKYIKDKFHKIIKQKANKYDEKRNKYESQKDDINKTKSVCHQLLNDSIEVEKLDERKDKICKMTKHILHKLGKETRNESSLNGMIMVNNNNDNNNDEEDLNMIIKAQRERERLRPYYKPDRIIHFFELLSQSALQHIENLDIIAKSIYYPKLLSLINHGKNHIILLKWFIDEKSDEQVKIEWVKIDKSKSDDDYKENDQDIFEEKEIDDNDWNYKLAKNGNMEFPINVKQNGKYLCRISYFNVLLRKNLMSNTMSISVKCNVLWDVFNSGNDVNFIGNRAKLSCDSWRTIFGKELIECNKNKAHNKQIYHYRIKIHHACDKGGGFMIGIIPNNKVEATLTRSFTRYGGFAINKGGLLFPGGRRYTNVTWRDGDIIDTYLDMNLLTLSFAYNGIHLGIACKNLPRQKYRFAITLLYQDDEVELIDLNK